MDLNINKTVVLDAQSGENVNSKTLLLKGNEVAQRMLQNAYNFFSENFPVQNPITLTAKCLKVSVATVQRYKDGPTPVSTTPLKRKRRKHLTEDINPSLGHEIKNVVYEMYTQKTPVTLSSLSRVLKEKEMYFGCVNSLSHVLHHIGFEYKKDDNRRSLMEKPHVTELRREFLTLYMRNEEKGASKKPYIFVDETWIFSNGSIRKSWQDDDIRSVKREKGEGNRYIILHAGGEKGFINNASLIFKASKNSGEYHGEMNSQIFEEWLKQNLLPALEEPSIIVMDNASYHSRQASKTPIKSDRKDVMQKWLKDNKIDFAETAKKNELMAIIKQHPKQKCYVSNTLAAEAGHEILRLPPYHCQFNAIEMVWSQAKRFYDKNILAKKNILETWKEALANVTESQWSNYVRHTDNVIKNYWEKEKFIINQPPIIINLDDDDYSSSDNEI